MGDELCKEKICKYNDNGNENVHNNAKLKVMSENLVGWFARPTNRKIPRIF